MDISREIANSRAALDDFIAAADSAASHWNTPRTPGKWSPAQVTEHVARVFDDAANMIDGRSHGFPKMPGLVRPVFRSIVLKRTIRSGKFPKARTFKPFDPLDGPETPAAARLRLTAAHERYLTACQKRAETDGLLTSTVFGTVPVADYMRFTTMHTGHHRKQIPAS